MVPRQVVENTQNFNKPLWVLDLLHEQRLVLEALVLHVGIVFLRHYNTVENAHAKVTIDFRDILLL